MLATMAIRASRSFALVLSLVVMAAVWSSCCMAPGSGYSFAPTGEGQPKWSASWLPLNVGDVWVYGYEFTRGSSVSTSTRVKWAQASTTFPGQIELLDMESDSYYLTSDDRKGWQLHGEFKITEADHFHLFNPPMTYLNEEIMTKGIREEKHQVIEEDGKPTGTIVESIARVIGWEEIEVPAMSGKVMALKTSFRYLVNGGVTFDADSWLVEGIGNVKRTMKLVNADGRVGFTVSMDLLAARVGGLVVPVSNQDSLAALVFRHAWERRERFGESFGGLEADFECFKDGKSTGKATINVAPTGRATCDVSALPEGEQSAAQLVLMMQFGHRRARSFDVSHSGHVFKLGESKGAGIAVDVVGDAMGSRYVVNNSSLRVVSRKDQVGGRQDVVVSEVEWTKGSYRPAKFRVDYSDAQGNFVKAVTYSNKYRVVDAEFIPSELEYVEEGVTRRYVMGKCSVVKVPAK